MKKTFEFKLCNNAEIKVNGNKVIITCEQDALSKNHTILAFKDENGYGSLRCTKNNIMSIKRSK